MSNRKITWAEYNAPGPPTGGDIPANFFVWEIVQKPCERAWSHAVGGHWTERGTK